MKTQPEYCQQAMDRLLSQMEDGAFNEEALESLCRQFPDCSDQLRASYDLWQNMDDLAVVPEPSQAMDAGFYKMLNDFSAQAATSRTRLPLEWWTWNGFSLKWAVIAGVFLLGLASGLFFQPAPIVPASLTLEEEMGKTTRESYAKLTSSSSASDRLLGLQMAKQLERPDDRILEALNHTLLYDENTNVRLSAIETMIHFSDNPQVRENLIRAIPYQTSPLVQLTLAEVVLALKDKRAVEEIRRLLQSEQVELEVKMKLEDTIETLL